MTDYMRLDARANAVRSENSLGLHQIDAAVTSIDLMPSREPFTNRDREGPQIGANVTLGFAASVASDCELLLASRLNGMLVGPAATARHVLRFIGPSLRPPIVAVSSQRRLRDIGDAGTVILRCVDRLSLPAQRELLTWLAGQTPRPQVISTAREPMLPKVAAGEFLEALYYRLNTVYVELASGH
jgi:hypothetical protein